MNNEPVLPFPVDIFLKLADMSYEESSLCVGEIECLVTEFAGYQVVAPRGTEADALISGNGWRDIVRDLRVIPWKDKRVGWSHAGFLKGARGIVDRGLFGMLRRAKPIVLVGHSLGGAIALNAAALLHAEGFDVHHVVTFGSPRTFKKGTAKRFRDTGINTVQYSNDGDPITDVPFRWWRFRHVNEVDTGRKTNTYSISENHLMPAYRDALSTE